jgi:AcrR family transcriptional regulator
MGSLGAVTDTINPKRTYTSRLREEQAQQSRRRITETARSLFVARGYQEVTVAEIAEETGVAYQTVYAAFGTKLRMAQEVIWTTFDVAGIYDRVAASTRSPDPEVWLRSAAGIARLVSERLGSLLRFMQESGDADLLMEYRKVQGRRLEQEGELATLLNESKRLRDGLSRDEALDILWAMTGTELHQQLVEQRGWSGRRYETWLGNTLIQMLLTTA